MRGLRTLPLLLVVLFAVPGASAQAPAKDRDKDKKETSPNPALYEIDGRNLAGWTKELLSPDPSVREEAIRAIMLYGEAASTEEVVNHLINRTMDNDTSPALRALQALSVVKIPEKSMPKALQYIGHRLTQAPETVIRAQAALTINSLGKDAAPIIPQIILGTQDKRSFDVRRSCAHALGQVGRGENDKTPPDKRCIVALLACLKDPALQVRMEGIFGLGNLGRPDDPDLRATVESELLRMAADKNKSVSIWAWMSFMCVNEINAAAIKAIKEHLNDKDPRVRSAAARGLAQLGTHARFAVADLANLLKDKDQGVVVAAIYAIAQIENPGVEAVNGLKALKDDKDAPEWLKKTAENCYNHVLKIQPEKKP